MTGTWLVWSNEHGAWWGPNQRGYTRVIQAAGRYTQAEAADIVDRATLGGRITVVREGPAGEPRTVPPEIAVPAPEHQ